MVWLVVIFSACAVGIIVHTFTIGRRLVESDRRIAELRELIDPEDGAS